MADIEGIARKIYDIIISPDTVTGLINGGLSGNAANLLI